ncbi:hypothetical protein AI2668V1_2737, partial [Citrobacter freundii]
VAANVEFDFPNYFEVDEEKLRRIHSILKNRLPEEHKDSINFIIKRSDNFIYQTESINDIIKEPNDSTSKIDSVKIYHESEDLNVGISLSNKNGASINVLGENRDDVFLLSSELKEYISKEVANIKGMKWLQAKNILFIMVIIFFGYVTYILSTIKTVDADTFKLALESTNLNDKLNYLIKKGNKELQIVKILTPMFLLLLALVTSQLISFDKIINFIYPVNIFLFGKEKTLIEKKKRNRSNIFWVICVGGALSLAIAFFSTKYM